MVAMEPESDQHQAVGSFDFADFLQLPEDKFLELPFDVQMLAKARGFERASGTFRFETNPDVIEKMESLTRFPSLVKTIRQFAEREVDPVSIPYVGYPRSTHTIPEKHELIYDVYGDVEEMLIPLTEYGQKLAIATAKNVTVELDNDLEGVVTFLCGLGHNSNLSKQEAALIGSKGVALKDTGLFDKLGKHIRPGNLNPFLETSPFPKFQVARPVSDHFHPLCDMDLVDDTQLHIEVAIHNDTAIYIPVEEYSTFITAYTDNVNAAIWEELAKEYEDKEDPELKARYMSRRVLAPVWVSEYRTTHEYFDRMIPNENAGDTNPEFGGRFVFGRRDRGTKVDFYTGEISAVSA